MKLKIGIALFCWATVVFAMVVVPAQSHADDNPAEKKTPDLILLKSGHELQGQLISQLRDEEDGRVYLVFRTKTGGLLKLDKSRLVRDIKIADAVDEEYGRRLAAATGNPDQLWALYDWCRDQDGGAVRFKSELPYLMNQIVSLDPNDERAWRKLDYDRIDGQWILKKQLYAGHGYQRQGTTWAPQIQDQIADSVVRQRQLEGERKAAFSRWERDVHRSSANRAEMAQRLFEFCDAIAVPIIMKKAPSEENYQIRLMYVEAMGKVPSANQPLCYFAIEDPHPDVRDRALTLLGQPLFDHARSVRIIKGHLTSNSNLMVRRAAFAMGELGDLSAVLPVIDALETTHKKMVGAGEGRMAMTFSEQGSGMQTGGKPIEVSGNVRNDASLMALRKLTDNDMGFDEEAWRRWYFKTYTLYDLNVRADE